ncbi:MAG: hypothetical protein EAZ42_07645 [Verrucomicrobia bacterium]|nr:MAG: hypothetical protein EAZ42_07645 [Verrucomicrobiota bacterium]
MSLRIFILGLFASFGVAWLAILIAPSVAMSRLAPLEFSEAVDGKTGVFYPKRTGRIQDGAKVYAANGCYQCHTQIIRPTYAGNDMYRADWAGLKADPDRGDTRRETNAYDFSGERFAQIGVMRLGPDLSNIGRRVESIYAVGTSPELWLYKHLYDPRRLPERFMSGCPSYQFLFVEKPVKGNRSTDALPFGDDPSKQVSPSPEAKALVSYLMSLKKDQPVPAALNFGPPKKEAK